MKTRIRKTALTLATTIAIIAGNTMAFAQSAYLEISLKIDTADRPAAVEVYTKYKQPFLATVPGATSKELLVRDEDVQVLHGFKSIGDAQNYLKSDLFNNDVVKALTPLLKAGPEVRIYTVN